MKGRKTNTDSGRDFDTDPFGSNQGYAAAAEPEKP